MTDEKLNQLVTEMCDLIDNIPADELRKCFEINLAQTKLFEALYELKEKIVFDAVHTEEKAIFTQEALDALSESAPLNSCTYPESEAA